MIFVIPYENGNVAKNFAESTTMRLYRERDGEIMAYLDVEVNDTVNETIALLIAYGVRAVLCGKIDAEAIEMLASNAIMVFNDYEGPADEIAELFAIAVKNLLGSTEGCGGGCGGCSGCGGSCDDDCGGECGGCGCMN